MSDTTMTPKIEVKNFNFYYGAFHALKNINLSIAENKVTAFIGPSGCGKSTLLRTFNRMYELYNEQRAEGEIWLDGENIVTKTEGVDRLRSKVGMVFQRPPLSRCPFMTTSLTVFVYLKNYLKLNSMNVLSGLCAKQLCGLM